MLVSKSDYIFTRGYVYYALQEKKIKIKLFINSFFILVNIAIKSTYKSTRGEKKYFYFLSAKRTAIILY